MWKCPTCDTNNASDHSCCAVCGTLQSETSAPKESRTRADEPTQGSAHSEQEQQTNQYAKHAEQQENQEQETNLAGSPGVDLRYNLTISLEESVFGAEKEIAYIREAGCAACGGSGAVPGTERIVCPTCKGTGQDRASHRFLSKQPDQPAAMCKTCHGGGKVPVAKCSVCHGLGRCSVHETKMFRLPPGINTGQALCVKDLGNVSYNDGPNGDLYVSMRITPHKKFTRDDYDLYADLPVPASTVASGGEVLFETLRDTVKFRIPQGTGEGDLIRLERLGVPHLSSSEVGDLLLKVRIV